MGPDDDHRASVMRDERSTRVEGGTWPLVSAVIPTRDRPLLMRRAVESVLAQKYPGRVECIIVFDQSEVLLPQIDVPEGFELRAITNERTPGLAGARNTGALGAKGEFLAFCDDDDEWLPDKLRRQVDRLSRDPDAVAVSSGVFVESRGRTIERVPPMDHVGFEDLLVSRQMELHSSNLLVRLSDFTGRVGLIDEELPGSQNEDYDWLLRAARHGSIGIVRDPLVRIHWQSSWFSERWPTLIAAHLYLLKRYPEFQNSPRGLARMYGQIAFYEAASGDLGSARNWASRSLRANWRERRAYLALAVSYRFVSAKRVVGWANRAGKGI